MNRYASSVLAISEKSEDGSTNSVLGSAAAAPVSKYSFSVSSRQARLNKEASQIRHKIQQLLEAVCRQQRKRSSKSSSPLKSSPISPTQTAPMGSAAALFTKRNPVSALFPGSAASGVLLNARHLRMNRQLTVSWSSIACP